MLFGSSFGFYYLFFLFGSMWFENWNLAYWVYKTASLELLNSKVWYFTPLTIFKVGNMYVCMYVCMYVWFAWKRERKKAFSRSWEAFSCCCSFRSEDHSLLDVLCSTLFSDSTCSVPFHYHIHLFSCQKKGL